MDKLNHVNELEREVDGLYLCKESLGGRPNHFVPVHLQAIDVIAGIIII